MAFTHTVTNAHVLGNLRAVHGTFTSASGDTVQTLDNSVHGLNYIVFQDVSLDTGGLNTPISKIGISSGTITATWDDTMGYSGTFYVVGR